MPVPLQRTVEAAASSVGLYSYSIYLQLSDWHINANRNVTSQQQTFRMTGSVIRCKRKILDEFGWDQKQNQVLSLSLCLSYMSKVLIVAALLQHFSTCVDSLTRAFDRQLQSFCPLGTSSAETKYMYIVCTSKLLKAVWVAVDPVFSVVSFNLFSSNQRLTLLMLTELINLKLAQLHHPASICIEH